MTPEVLIVLSTVAAAIITGAVALVVVVKSKSAGASDVMLGFTNLSTMLRKELEVTKADLRQAQEHIERLQLELEVERARANQLDQYLRRLATERGWPLPEELTE